MKKLFVLMIIAIAFLIGCDRADDTVTPAPPADGAVFAQGCTPPANVFTFQNAYFYPVFYDQLRVDFSVDWETAPAQILLVTGDMTGFSIAGYVIEGTVGVMDSPPGFYYYPPSGGQNGTMVTYWPIRRATPTAPLTITNGQIRVTAVWTDGQTVCQATVNVGIPLLQFPL